MKKYYYLIFESIIIALIIVLIIVVNILVQSVFCYVFSIMAIIYFSSIILRSVKLLFDITQGVKEKYTIFLGNHGSEKLDVFSKITFTSIYFDDEELTKDYIIFDDIEHDEISRGDRIFIEYYPNSRIVTSITRARTKTQGDG